MRPLLMCFCLSLMLMSIAAEDGPGIPAIDFAGEGLSQFDMISELGPEQGIHSGLGFTMMHRGYLVTLWSNDGGGGGGSGGITVLDISDPHNPEPKFTTKGNPDYDSKEGAHYAGNLGESHGSTFAGDIWVTRGNRGGETGLIFWDMSNPLQPLKLSSLPLEGLSGGDYSSTVWWIAWQGQRYVYVAGSSGGLYIVDAADPSNPIVVRRLTTGEMAGFRINTCFVLGNLLVIAGSDASGIATFDISDPADPQFIHNSGDAVGYSMMINGNRIYGASSPARYYNLAADGTFGEAIFGPKVAKKGGYGVIQDENFVYGSSSAGVLLDVSGETPFSLGTVSPTGFDNADWDFLTPLGNIGLLGNDHGSSAMIVLHTDPDTTGPEVNMVHPFNGATEQATTSRVGLTFTDSIDTRSIDTDTIIVRPQGGSALNGTYSHQTGIVNFWPDQDLLPGTIYEVEVPAGGIRDWAGNANTQTFTSAFITAGESLTPSPPVVTEEPQSQSVFPGQGAVFSAAVIASPAPNLQWQRFDGTAWLDISGANSGTLSIAEVSIADVGSYRLYASNSEGSAASQAATLTVKEHPEISDLQVASGKAYRFEPNLNIGK